MNVPFNKSRRCTGVREAESRLLQRRAEYDRLLDGISNELHGNYERLLESSRTSRLFSDRIVPAAEKNGESAGGGNTAGNVDFLRLIETQRQLIELREQQVETISDYHHSGPMEFGQAAVIVQQCVDACGGYLDLPLKFVPPSCQQRQFDIGLQHVLPCHETGTSCASAVSRNSRVFRV